MPPRSLITLESAAEAEGGVGATPTHREAAGIGNGEAAEHRLAPRSAKAAATARTPLILCEPGTGGVERGPRALLIIQYIDWHL